MKSNFQKGDCVQIFRLFDGLRAVLLEKFKQGENNKIVCEGKDNQTVCGGFWDNRQGRFRWGILPNPWIVIAEEKIGKEEKLFGLGVVDEGLFSKVEKPTEQSTFDYLQRRWNRFAINKYSEDNDQIVLNIQ
ncbi:MAG: hypothetical protein AAB432_01240 [Patescibacteria group bacterium]